MGILIQLLGKGLKLFSNNFSTFLNIKSRIPYLIRQLTLAISLFLLINAHAFFGGIPIYSSMKLTSAQRKKIYTEIVLSHRLTSNVRILISYSILGLLIFVVICSLDIHCWLFLLFSSFDCRSHKKENYFTFHPSSIIRLWKMEKSSIDVGTRE